MTGPELSLDRLPIDWYKRFGARLIKECINDEWESWPSWYKRRVICERGYTSVGVDIYNPKTDRSILTGNGSNKPFELGYAYHFYNKSAVIYLAIGGDPSKNWRINSLTWPVTSDEWLSIAYQTWAEECSARERHDARFALAPYRLSIKYDQDLTKAIGLGEPPEGPLEEIVGRLIAFHVDHCDKIHTRATKTITAKEDASLWRGEGEGHAIPANTYYSSLAPTCRAVLLIGRCGMTESLPVLMVLTGHNEDMKCGAPTFDAIPSEDIISKRSDHIIEVSLQTAIRYLRLLERKEEEIDDEYRRRNDARREAIHSDMVKYAHKKMQYLLEAIEKRGESFEFWRHGPSGMPEIWRRIVEDEEEFKILEVTKALRRKQNTG